MIGYYSYTVILTYMSLISSVLGMFFALGIGDCGPHPEYAIICLMVSGLQGPKRTAPKAKRNSVYRYIRCAMQFVSEFCLQLSVIRSVWTIGQIFLC